jgi:hypothetical protein
MTLDRPYRWALSCDDAAEEPDAIAARSSTAR